ncbi:MFS transporter [Pseudoclavibacter sp. RFBJ3]|uniref:MFS transporter n=1 Tax=unclassified Pseudoclavibacter TaxID=2615177 RepID=UPI000CE870FD|nr:MULTISPECIES: MFS transporter [unclassified Pseudoclavibacter]MBF4552088.1 MHS family MFS transporter [Pseudoclavibacter sp. VKM Ac-2888]PPF33373.1 MFS transporter [Pseudoclavibacter sp. AY1H1]PPF77138.1 MFS transporter [Pseudoclavibacter sp. Z016]PPF80889.1 MFS transporter [Pseudoclavibacter sp. RFBJ5]PPF94398.1 MFS transporter [Pseudoclavibacter sp. RFBJ3]
MSHNTQTPASGAASGPPSGAPASAPKVSLKDARRIAFAAFVGTALEWYDYFLFGTAAALVFNRLFFTDLDPAGATLAAFATFGVGFAARPIGAVVFGWIGDRYGRRPALLTTIVMIGCATGLIGVLPDYLAVGIAAPIMLAVLRLVQGFAVGGEWGGATTIAIEHSPEKMRGRFAALVQIGSPVGTLVSSGAFALVLMMPPETFDAWGWRLPFLLAFPLLGIALYIRLKVEESPVFKELAAAGEQVKVPVLELFRKSGLRLLVAVAAAMLGVGGFYMMTTFVVSYGTNVLEVDRQVMVNATLIAAVLQIGVTIFAGRLAERFGPGRMTVVGGLTTGIAAFPLFWLIDTESPIAITAAVSIGIALITLSYAVTGALLAELFPPRLRYSGVSLGYNLAGAISGFLPLIATALITVGDGSSWPAVLVLIGICLVTVIGGAFGERMRLRDDIVEIDHNA